MCMVVTEPTVGSDPLATMTKAKLDGDEYVVNGGKCSISDGSIAHICVFVAKTDEGSKSLSAFVVEKGTSGFELGIRENQAGFRAMEVSEISFTQCRIPIENRIGKEGEGLKAALTTISEIGRMGNTAVRLGIARAAYEAALKFAKEKTLYGKPIAQLQAIQFMLADMDMEIEATKWLEYHAAWLLDQGKSGREITREISMANAYSSEVARRTAIKAVRIHGACGTLPEFHVMHYLRDALGGISSAGTNEIMRVILDIEKQ